VQEVFADRTFDQAATTTHGGGAGVQLKNWWHQTQLGMPWLASKGWNGQGQTIVVIDSGVDKTHPWLAGRVINEACFSTNSNGTGACNNGSTYQYSAAAGGVAGSAAPCTHNAHACSHGTHVAHIAAGTYGAAPGARIIAIRASHPEWDATLGVYVPKYSLSDLANALWYVYDPLPYVPAAVNLSVGGGAYSGYCDADPALRNLAAWFTALKRDYGITTVVASGNDNHSQYVGAPACASNAVSVGNSTLDPSGYDAVLGNVKGGSNSNSTLDLLAPGTDICSAVPVAFDLYDGVKDGIACDWFGTSMAAPQVAGAIAVLRQGRPTATSDQMLAALQRRGTAVTDSRNNITRTRINIANAVYYF
jgi:subtilisin family serine protease